MKRGYQPDEKALRTLRFVISDQSVGSWTHKPRPVAGEPAPATLYYVRIDENAFGLIRDEGKTARLPFSGCALSKRGFWEVLQEQGGYREQPDQ